jgi:CspA family cold shock protein
MSNQGNGRPQDQLRYCERCGISFLWTAEEQRAADHSQGTPPAPDHCPGCRLLTPAAGRERGVVKWYNFRKRYGFIVRRDQPEIFAHGSELEGSGGLRPGDLVEFTASDSDRGPIATAIRVIGHTEAPIPD